MTAYLIFGAWLFSMWLTAVAVGHRPAAVPRPIRVVFGDRAAVAACVFRAETRGQERPWRAVGRAGELGGFQIHPTHFGHVVSRSGRRVFVDPGRLFNPWFNTRVAFVISRGGTDWSAWTTAGRCT